MPKTTIATRTAKRLKPTRAVTRPKARAAARGEARAANGHGGLRDRVRPQFAVLRSALIHIMAGRKVATTEIADALGVNRSYVIRLTDFGMKPLSPAERAVAKLATKESAALAKMGMGFATREGFDTVLAGDDGKRGKGGGRPAQAAKAAKRAKATPKAAAKAAAPKGRAKPAPKVAKAPPKAAKAAKAPTRSKRKAPDVTVPVEAHIPAPDVAPAPDATLG